MKRKSFKSTNNIILLATAMALAGCSSEMKHIDIQDTISKMSLEDKAHFVIGTGMKGVSGNNAVIGSTQSLVPGAAGTTYPLDSLGLPAIVLASTQHVPTTKQLIIAPTSPSAHCLPRHGTNSSLNRWDRPSAKRLKPMVPTCCWLQRLTYSVTRCADATSNTILRTRSWPERQLPLMCAACKKTAWAQASNTFAPTTKKQTA